MIIQRHFTHLLVLHFCSR